MKIEIMTEIQSSFAEKLVIVWEASVRATHDFLREEDICFFKPLVRKAVEEVGAVAYSADSDGSVAGFMVVADETIEMLFIHPNHRGLGLGRQFVNYATDTLKARLVDVNEQNAQAAGFYRRMGFVVVGRSPLDSTGKPFPILHMEKRGEGSL